MVSLPVIILIQGFYFNPNPKPHFLFEVYRIAREAYHCDLCSSLRLRVAPVFDLVCFLHPLASPPFFDKRRNQYHASFQRHLFCQWTVDKFVRFHRCLDRIFLFAEWVVRSSVIMVGQGYKKYGNSCHFGQQQQQQQQQQRLVCPLIRQKQYNML